MENRILEENIEERNSTQEIFDLIRKSKNSKLLAQTLTNYHDNDIADALTYLSPEERKRLYKAIGTEATSRIFAYLDEDVDKYFAELENEKAADILEEMDADDAIDILEGLDKKKADEIINLIEPEQKSDIQLIKSYKDNEFGSLMTTNFITIRHGLSIKKSIDHLIEEAKENDNIETIYIVNDKDEFYGALTLRDLLITKKDEDLEEKIILSYPFVYDKEEITDAAIDTLADYSEDSIPVLNKETNEIIGIITSADIVELINKDEEEETAKPVDKETKKVSYLEPTAFVLILLVALNRIIGILPSYFYVEIALIVVAVLLEGYSYLSKNDLSLKPRS